MEYPKIHTLWKRDMEHGKELIVGEYSKEEFHNITRWHVEEKVDGMNIRVFWDKSTIKFEGRTADSQLPAKLVEVLQRTFTVEKMKAVFPDGNVILFGEGYGSKIQSGGNYRSDMGFIIFDVYCGSWWLDRESVADIAKKLDVPMVPFLGIMDQHHIVEYIKSKPMSKCSQTPQIMEGVVCRTDPLMLYRNGTPILMKLKVKDYYAPTQKKERIQE
jgi:ATP-dependent RNA circularization protein (DNA/RNA ligase family)